MIYLDANASSRLRPELQLAFHELVLENGPRNSSSVHQAGRLARARMQASRKAVLSLLNLGGDTRGQKLVFTSGATEACNQMMFGFLGGINQLHRHPGTVLTSAIEHPCVLEPAAVLERCGWKVNRIAPAKDGVVRVQDFLAALTDDTALVSLMAANNETGAVQPIEQLAGSLRALGYRGPIVCDFTQAVGKTELNAGALFEAGVTAIALSGHKLGAPAGIGALVFSENKRDICFVLEPLIRGGAQEYSLRGGTENLFGALAFGEACRLQLLTLTEDLRRKRKLRELLWEELRNGLTGIERLTLKEDFTDESALEPKTVRTLCNTLLIRFEECRGDDLVVALDLDGLAVSTGSACASGKQSVSHVVTAMGYEPAQAREAVRFSIDWDTTEEDIRSAAAMVQRSVFKMRGKKAATELAVHAA